MVLYQAGNLNAFSTLFSRFERPVFSYLKSKLSKKELAEEVFQDCFMKLHRSRFLYDPKYPFKAFLFTIARTVLIDHFRKSGREIQLQIELTENAEDELSMEAVEVALSSLPPREQTAITGRFIEDKTFQELAVLLDTSEVNARQIISRSISKLKKILLRPPQTGGSKT
ncbi:MAG: sigma-70 family RNA polymerase sigma factor [Bdellovibrio sp.]|nr:sigma-70 family RNA polymerase sigma factor [Bdellovibrio sp.]